MYYKEESKLEPHFWEKTTVEKNFESYCVICDCVEIVTFSSLLAEACSSQQRKGNGVGWFLFCFVLFYYVLEERSSDVVYPKIIHTGL